MPKKVASPARKKSMLAILAIPAGILVITGLVYLKSLNAEFLTYDDTDNVVNNPMIRQLSLVHIRQFFSGAFLYMYTPVTFITYAIDFRLSGMDPFFFKLTNIFLHLFNVVLVFLFSYRLLKSNYGAALMATLFALHPLNVDTVSWISARSNLLATLFFFLSLLFYLNYLEEKKIIWFFMVIFSFLLSLLSKSAGVMLPLVLVLIDYLQHRRITFWIILEKLPVFLLSLFFGVLALYFRSDSGNPQTLIEYNLLDRFLIICHCLVSYFFKSIFPFRLSEIYAYPMKTNGFLPFFYYFTPFLILAAILLVSHIKTLKREMIFGFLFFTINILVTQMVLLEDGYMANRYAYLPATGFWFIITIWYSFFSGKSKSTKTMLTLSIAALCMLFSMITYKRSQIWKNTLTLFNNAVEHEPGSAFAFNNRGVSRYTGNDLAGALADYHQAIRLHPRYAGAFYNRGIVYYAMNEFGNANEDYTTAIAFNPDFASCYMARGILEMDVLQNDTLSLIDYNRAILLNPSMAQAYYNRGILYLRLKNVPMACNDFQQVRKLGYDRADDLIHKFCD